VTLNELYGPGSTAALAAALDPPNPLSVVLTPTDLPDRVRLHVKWTAGVKEVATMKVDFFQDTAHFLSLRIVEEYQGRGICSRMVWHLLDFLESKGVSHVTASPANDYSSWVFQLVGFEVQDGLRLRCEVGDNTRRKEYVDWKFNNGQEPEWHVKLRERPVQPSGPVAIGVDD
jgi:ribosomal protein S18 acetylase RimI-like enzyme